MAAFSRWALALIIALVATFSVLLVADPARAQISHPEGDTWTVVGVMPGGQACFIASGSHWEVHEFTPAGSET